MRLADLRPHPGAAPFANGAHVAGERAINIQYKYKKCKYINKKDKCMNIKLKFNINKNIFNIINV